MSGRRWTADERRQLHEAQRLRRQARDILLRLARKRKVGMMALYMQFRRMNQPRQKVKR